MFPDARALRAWFAKNAAKAPELWIVYYKVGSGKESVRYQEALDEALCVGWIDGQAKGIDEERYMQRWTPRRKGSYWSAVNVKKAQALIAAGRMKKAGLAAFEARDKDEQARYSFENAPQTFPDAMEAAFRKHAAAWAWWQKAPPSYRKPATWLVLSAKREETRMRRLQNLIEASARGERIRELARAEKKAAPAKKKPARRTTKRGA